MIYKRPRAVGVPAPRKGKDKFPKKGRRKILIYQILFSLLIFLVVASVFESRHPWSKSVKEGAKALFTWQIDYTPAVGTVRKILDPKIWTGLFPGKKEPAIPAAASTDDSRYMVIPVSGKILRQFGWHINPLDQQERFHEGLDIQASRGTSIKAALDGTIKKIGMDEVLGKYLIIKHSGESQSLYAHCSEIKVEEGQFVKTGEVIAKVGNTGAVTEAQLHFEVREKGQLIDPLTKFKLSKDV